MNSSLKKSSLYLLILLIQSLIYNTTGFLNTSPFQALRNFDLSIPLDHQIPFIPETIWLYCLYYLILLAAFVLAWDKKIFVRFLKSFILMTAIADVFFVLIPVSMPLPPMSSVDQGTATYALLDYILTVDTRSNCFPSLHCAHAFLITFWAWKSELFPYYLKILMLLMTLAVVIATLLVKQHWFIDIVGAFLLFNLIKKVYEKKFQHQPV